MGIAAVQPGAGTAPYASRWPACRTRSRRAAGPGGTRGVRHGGGGGEPSIACEPGPASPPADEPGRASPPAGGPAPEANSANQLEGDQEAPVDLSWLIAKGYRRYQPMGRGGRLRVTLVSSGMRTRRR